MTITQLEYLVAIETHGHFGRAAVACGVTQPTLSIQIGKLEEELETRLFDRTRQPVVATEAGGLVIQQARAVLRETARVRELCDEARGKVVGELRIGILPTLGPYLLPRFVHTLTKKYPGLRLVVEERVTDIILEQVRQGTLDGGLVASEAVAPDLHNRALFEEPLVGYVSRSHRLADRAVLRVEDLSLDDLWLLAEAHCLHRQTARLCRDREKEGRSLTTCPRVIRIESGNLETLTRLVAACGGMTLLPHLAVVDDPPTRSEARLIQFALPRPARSIVLVRRRPHLKERLMEVFLSEMLDSLPPDIARLSAPLSPARVGGAEPR